MTAHLKEAVSIKTASFLQAINYYLRYLCIMNRWVVVISLLVLTFNI